MTVTHSESVLIAPLNLRISYSSDESAPLFYILKNGRLYQKTYATSIVVPVDINEDTIWEVFDSSSYSSNASVMDRRMEFDWGSVDDVDYYRIDYNDSGYSEYDRIYSDGSSRYHYRSRQLSNAATHQFRVVPVGTNGNEGTSRTFSAYIAGLPAQPGRSSTYNSGKATIVIS